MKRPLNGWQRLGIVASVVWALYGVWWGLKLRYDPIWETYSDCLGAADSGLGTDEACRGMLQQSLAVADVDKWLATAFVALVPIPIAWLIVYGLLRLVRWVRRGFAPS